MLCDNLSAIYNKYQMNLNSLALKQITLMFNPPADRVGCLC